MGKIKLILCLIFVIILCISGGKILLSSERIESGKGKEIDYEICKKGHIPNGLENFIQTAKVNPCSFTLKDSGNLYIVICYGEKNYTGYSVQVKKFEEKNEILRIKTHLKGPSGKEEKVHKKSYPYIVIKCKIVDDLCIIES